MNVEEGGDFAQVLLAPCEKLAGMGNLCRGKFRLRAKLHASFFRCLLLLEVLEPCTGEGFKILFQVGVDVGFLA